MTSKAISIGDSYQAFNQLLAVIRSSMRDDSDMTEITKRLQHFFNKTSDAYKTSAEFHSLLKDTTSAVEQEQNKAMLDKILLRFINELKAYKRGSNNNSQAVDNNGNEAPSVACSREERNCDAPTKSICAKRLLDDKNPNDGQSSRKRVCLTQVASSHSNSQHPELSAIGDNKTRDVIKSEDSIAKTSSAVSQSIDKSIVESIEQRKTDKQIKRLEQLLFKIDRKIKKLQQCELSVSDMDDDESSYVMEERYKKKFMKVWQMLCKLKGRTTSTGRCTEEKLVCEAAGSRYPQLNRKVENLLAKTKTFPDFQDIYDLVQRCNTKFSYNLGKNKNMTAEELARLIFVEMGKKLQARRQKDLRTDFGCFLTDEEMILHDDPAASDEQLQQQLMANDCVGRKNLDYVIEKYANRQDTEDDEDDDGVGSGSDTNETVDNSEDEAVVRSNDNSNGAEEDDVEWVITPAADAGKAESVQRNSSDEEVMVVESKSGSMDVDTRFSEMPRAQREPRYAALPDIVTDSVRSSSLSAGSSLEYQLVKEDSNTRLGDLPLESDHPAGFLSSRHTMNRLQDLLGPILANAGLICGTNKRTNEKLSLHKTRFGDSDDVVEICSSPEPDDYQQFMLVHQKPACEMLPAQSANQNSAGHSPAVRNELDVDVIDDDDDSTEDESGNACRTCNELDNKSPCKPSASTSTGNCRSAAACAYNTLPASSTGRASDNDCVLIDSD